MQNNHDIFYYKDLPYNIKELKKGDYIRGNTMPYSAKYIDYNEEVYGFVVSSDHSSIFDVIVKSENGTVVNAVCWFMRADCMIEKLDK